MVMRSLAVIALTVGVTLAACSSAKSDPNVTPGQCVLSEGVWHCGTGYGNIPACPGGDAGAQPGDPCDYDGGWCFECYFDQVAGLGCSCAPGDTGTPVWQCLPTGTGCGP
jgi:hypothetical protein